MKFNISCNSILAPMRILQDQLDKLDINYLKHEEGYVEIAGNLPSDMRPQLDDKLSRYSVAIIEDEKECLVQRVKNILFEVVNTNKHQVQTLSCYLTDRLGFSYGYISGLFASHTFCSIEQYTIMLRVERAKRMIIEDELSLKQISDALSYSSLGHFSKQFKKSTGITLSDFRKIILRRKNGNY
ncbi:helix-turn-helix transcriptional regulator [Flavobacterium sp. MAH-1]|uniref:Helix-turn-helix transcriptional regulator n=1 Tax=Flavobacterium agri TaxID=2743471 RepID=A0A7Y9C8A1_9FLAO|nr:AraC family transcriptional regulator [Flavobacterium agri]NUY82173.1 helix-turn-helix transcriptional regulator [Flavobacterium agri]NYA72197.1 helix-turn-helix transcriptional regulator [Flavobacterium agri]